MLSTIPMAVITESKEKTASKTTICATTAVKLAYTTLVDTVTSGLPSIFSCSSVTALYTRNKPPNNKIRSRPDKVQSNTVMNACVKVNHKARENNRTRRMNKARDKRMTRASSRCSGRRSSARMEMKTRISIPKTISRIIRVIKPTQIPGSSKNSIRQLPRSSKLEIEMEDQRTARDPLNLTYVT